MMGNQFFILNLSKEGLGSVIISSKDAESYKLTLDFYQTKSQKTTSKSKIFELAKNKGYSNIVAVIENMELESSKIVLGNANIDEMIQKIESNEYEIVKFIFKEDNEKIIVELEIKPTTNQ